MIATVFTRVSPTARALRGAALLALALGTTRAVAQAPGTAAGGDSAGDMAGTLKASDSALVIDSLPNGLRYYLRVNHVPAQRAELRLVVNAGSALEDESQRGLAHFVEHMAFSGTTHFQKHEIQRYLESMGMRFGGDLNAATNYDATTYRLTIPTDQPDALSTGIAILADWAHGISFDSAAVEAERGIILGEWRSRHKSTSNDEVQERYTSTLFAGSPYAKRMPIGLPDVIRSAPRSELVRFYHDWY